MTSGDWPELETIFLEAHALDSSERAAFLDQACAGQPDLRAEVESLLAADEARGDFLEIPVSRLAAGLVREPQAPHFIGRYRIVSVLGEGGMGTVYQAEQQSPHRKVALKVIRAGMAFQGMLRRFELEAEALGRLQHAGIAQIYDAGTFEASSGPQPYFAMEFIKGRPLLAYADEHSLPTGERLQLMAKICDAVDHAHRNGILHRDLKPGNILVDETGQTKILDFGVARIMDSDVQATRQTDIGQLIGTLEYMSPEQTLGDPQLIDARSDVYSLGVIFYQLLAGKMPYDTRPHALPDVVRMIREDDPEPLSLVSRSYRGDIDVIAAKALEKDRERRYASAAAMAGDIRRHLANQPIVARRASASYRTAKFIRRYRTLVAVISVAGVLILAFGVSMAILAVRYAQQRDTAQQASGFLFNLFARADPFQTQGRPLSARDLLDIGAGQLSKGFQLQPSVRAQMEGVIAIAYQHLGALDRAEALFSAQMADYERLKDRPLMAQTVRMRADVRRQRGELKDAEDDLRKALALLAGMGGDPIELGDVDNNLGLVLVAEGKPGEACPLFERAVAISEKLPSAEVNTLVMMSNWGATLGDLAQYSKAERMLREVLQRRRKLLGENHPQVARSMMRLGRLLAEEGSYAEAESLSLAALEGVRRTIGPEHLDVMATLNNLGLLYRELGRNQEAEERLRAAAEMARRVLGPAHADTSFYQANLGLLLIERGSLHAAEPLLREALANARAAGRPSRNTAAVLGAYGRLLIAQGKWDAAEPFLQESLTLRQTQFGKSHPLTAAAFVNLSALRLAQNRCDQAVSLSSDALAIARQFLPERHAFTATAALSLAQAWRACGQPGKADALAQEALRIRTELMPADAWQITEVRRFAGAAPTR